MQMHMRRKGVQSAPPAANALGSCGLAAATLPVHACHCKQPFSHREVLRTQLHVCRRPQKQHQQQHARQAAFFSCFALPSRLAQQQHQSRGTKPASLEQHDPSCTTVQVAHQPPHPSVSTPASGCLNPLTRVSPPRSRVSATPSTESQSSPRKRVSQARNEASRPVLSAATLALR